MDRDTLYLKTGYICTGRLCRTFEMIDSTLHDLFKEKGGELGGLDPVYKRLISEHMIPKAKRFKLPEVLANQEGLEDRIIDLRGDSPSLLLIGLPGTGKTCAGYSIMHDTIARREIVGWNELLKIFSSAAGYDDRAQADLELFTTTELLMVDDFGRTAVKTDNRHAALFELVDTRYRQGLKTVYTSNLGSEQLLETVGDAILDRIAENRYKFEGPSYRTSF